jgi:UDP-N-acetyl-D-glucosamine dehydrogenase
LAKADSVSICVPTPLSKSRDPDISFILAATEEIRKYLHNGQLIVLESTTYPGTTEELILPELSGSGLKVGSDFYLAFSPERIDPGNTAFTTRNTPKIVGGITPECTEIARLFYSQFIEKSFSSHQHQVCGDGEAPGKYFSQRQYRHGERDGADV